MPVMSGGPGSWQGYDSACLQYSQIGTTPDYVVSGPYFLTIRYANITIDEGKSFGFLLFPKALYHSIVPAFYSDGAGAGKSPLATKNRAALSSNVPISTG